MTAARVDGQRSLAVSRGDAVRVELGADGNPSPARDFSGEAHGPLEAAEEVAARGQSEARGPIPGLPIAGATEVNSPLPGRHPDNNDTALVVLGTAAATQLRSSATCPGHPDRGSWSVAPEG